MIPLRDKNDLFERYNFIKKFLKESKQFGVMRRTSEKRYSEFALKGKGWHQDYKQDDYRRFEKQDSVAHLFTGGVLLEEGIIYTKELTFMSFKKEIHLDITTVPRIPFSETIRDLEYVTNLEVK